MSKRYASILAFSFALLVPHTLAAQYYACIYRSGLPLSPRGQLYTTQISPIKGEIEDLRAAWKAYAEAQYPGLNGDAQCYTGAQAIVDASRAALKQNYRNGKITDVDWVYDVKMTATPSKAGVAYGFCSSGAYAGNTVYETPVFEIPMDDAWSSNSPVEVTYLKYLEAHYKKTAPYNDWRSYSLACPHNAGTLTATEAHRQNLEQQAKASGKNVVVVDWKYKRTADTPPASPRPKNIH